jgi:hypothetical protein
LSCADPGKIPERAIPDQSQVSIKQNFRGSS